MTTTKTIRLERTGLSPIDVEPVWVEDAIQHFDMFNKGWWMGSKRLLRYCEHLIKQSLHEDDWMYTKEELKTKGFKEFETEIPKRHWFEDKGVCIKYNNLIRSRKLDGS